MKSMKKYMEQYARLSLIYCYNKELSLLQDRENPDWQCEELGIGMEVTEALERKDGRKRFVINQYFKKGLFDQNVKKEFEEKYPEYNSRLVVENNIACFSDSYDVSSKIRQVCLAIILKTSKLNSHYTKFEQNWLYIFASEQFVESAVPEVLQAYQKTISQDNIVFDKIFLNALDSIFVLNQNGLECKILLSEDCLKRLKAEARKNSP